MKTVILAGGLGNRVYPLSLTKPKPMFKILGKPLLQYVIETLRETNLKDLIIVTGHYSDQIKNYFGDGKNFGVNIQYTHQNQSLGMANAVQTVKDLVNDNFLVVNGDDIFDASLINEKINLMKKSGSNLILSCKEVTETWKFGILKINHDDKVEKIVEKPSQGEEPSSMAVIGVYILPKNIFDYYDKVPVNDSQHEAAIQKYIDDGHSVYVIKYNGDFVTYKYPWDLLTINQYLMNKLITKQTIEDGVEISKTATINGNVWIRKGAKINDNAVINGPAYVGLDSIIGTNSLVRNFSSIGDKSIVGFSSEISDSIIGDNSGLHTNYIGDSIIGDNCNLGAGTITANLRHDNKTIRVHVNGQLIDTGKKKFGIVMGDYTRTGINNSFYPGISIGPFSWTAPGTIVKETVEPLTVFDGTDKKSLDESKFNSEIIEKVKFVQSNLMK